MSATVHDRPAIRKRRRRTSETTVSGVNMQPLMPDELVDQLLGLKGQVADHQVVLLDERPARPLEEADRHIGQQVAVPDDPQRISEVIDDCNDRPGATSQAEPPVDHA